MTSPNAQKHTPQFPTPPAPPGLPVAGADLASLQAQLADLQVQHSGLEAQWRGLRRQLDEMLQSNPARPGVVQQWADAGVQIANVEGKIAGLQARIAQAKGLPLGTTTQPSTPPRSSINPNVAIPLATAVLIAFLFPLAIGWGRRIARGKPQPASLPADQVSRLERLEHAIDTIAIEVERISEGQRFVTRILAERPGQGAAAASSGGPLSEAAPPLALGAGPMEPISVAERERVGQRIKT